MLTEDVTITILAPLDESRFGYIAQLVRAHHS